MRYILLFLSLAIIPLMSVAVAAESHGNCVLEKQYEQHPFLKPSNNLQAQTALENFSSQFVLGSAAAAEDIVIPVVFHVMQNPDPGDEAISDSQMIEAIEQVNEDFNGQNARRSGNIYDQFLNIEADVGVRFELAKRDPDGYPSNGITRTTSVFTSNGGQIEIKETIQWPRDRYLNIWVVLSSDGGSGSAFAFLPSSVADRPVFDGIITSHWAVGRTGTAVDTHLGNLTHEIGHWANLNHTWGSTTDNGSSAACNEDDGVSDTPNTTGHSDNNSCGSQLQSCGSTDNVSNFMDYACEVMYTEGQKTRMVAALNSSVSGRNNTWSTENQIATGVKDTPVYALFKANKEWVEPGGSVTYTDESFVNSGGSITSWEWSFPGGSPSSHNGRTPPAVTYNTPGVYQVSLKVSSSSGSNTRVRPTQIDVNNNLIIGASGSSTVNADNGWFYDSNFKGNYGNDESGVLTIKPNTSGRVIEIDFYEFNMEDGNDQGVCEWESLEVYDGVSTSATLIGTYCGKSPKPTIRATNSDGALTFRFKSDDNTGLPGWRAKVTAVDPNSTSNDILMGSTSSVTNCDAKFYDSGKFLPYKNSENSSITFNAVTAGNPVSVNFLSFRMEADNCEYDYMEVFDGTSTGSNQIGGKYCGTNSPGNLTANNSSGALTFKFVSDDNTVMSGWEADVSCEGGGSSSGGSSSGGSSSGGSSSGGNELQNGVPVSGLSASTGNDVVYTIDVPSGASNLVIKIEGGSGDADLYTRAGAVPTDSTYACRPYAGGNSETCTEPNPSSGTWYARVKAYESFSNVTLTASYDGGGSSSGGSSSGGSSSGGSSSGGSSSGGSSSGGNELQNGVPVNGLSASTGNDVVYTIDVPSGASNLVIKIEGGSGDADLYTRAGAVPTDSTYACRPYAGGNSETCTEPNPSSGTWYARVKAYESFSNVTLTASYDGGGSSSGGSSSGGSSSGGSSSGGSSSGGSSSGGNELQNGVPVNGLSASTGNDVVYSINVPSGASNLVIKIEGGSGDADLYTRAGAVPTDSTYACRPYAGGNSETCTEPNPSSGTWYARVKAYETFSNVTLTASFDGGGSSSGGSSSGGSSSGGSSSGGSSSGGSSSGGGIDNACASESPHSGNGVTAGDTLCVPDGSSSSTIRYFWVYVPSNTNSMVIRTQHGSGNGNLYYKASSWANSSNADQSSTNSGNTESITVNNPPSGYRYISVIGQQSGMSLRIDLQ